MADPLEPLRRAADRTGLFLDFDGTLSPIVQVPSEARPLEGIPELLAALARRLGLVAVVSGRSAHQLLEWLGPDVEIWGLHGAEHVVDGRVRLSERAAPFAEPMATVHEDAARELRALGLEGVILENKGVMLALHYRRSPDPNRASLELAQLATTLAERNGLIKAEGRMVYELRPPVEFSKAQVILHRARDEHLTAAAFIGDDTVDLPAFEALDELSAEGITAIRVAVDSPEVPYELIARADVVVAGPEGVAELLRSLLD